MAETILLVDYENVKDTGLRQLPAHDRVQLFVGKGQRPKIAFIEGALEQGARLDLIQVAEQGRNNLDFYIAFYLGKLLQEESGARVIVFSNDQDLDPLIAHLAKRGIPVMRMGTTPATRRTAPVAAKPPPLKTVLVKPAPRLATRTPAKVAQSRPAIAKPAEKKPHPADVEDAITFLRNAGKRQPKGRRALINSLADHLRLSTPEAGRVVEALMESGFLSISKENVTYR